MEDMYGKPTEEQKPRLITGSLTVHHRLTTGLSAGRKSLFVSGCWPVYRRLFVYLNVFHAMHVREYSASKIDKGSTVGWLTIPSLGLRVRSTISMAIFGQFLIQISKVRGPIFEAKERRWLSSTTFEAEKRRWWVLRFLVPNSEKESFFDIRPHLHFKIRRGFLFGAEVRRRKYLPRYEQFLNVLIRRIKIEHWRWGFLRFSKRICLLFKSIAM